MDSQQIALVRLSFARISGREVEAGRLFYRRLFEIAPEIKPLFKSDIEVQGQKVMHMIGLAAGMLSNANELTVVLNSLAKRHVRYGARIEHFEAVGQALLWTIEQICGDDFTPQVRDGWIAAYTEMAAIMRRAMQSERQITRRVSAL